MKCDVLVVGASSAGMMAAISAARSGSDVILLDRNLAKTIHTANTLFLGMASRSGLRVDNCYIKKSLLGMRIISPSGHGVTIPAMGYFIDRKRFDNRHLCIAEKEGVMLLQEDACKLLVGPRNCRVVAKHGEINSSIVIDASGVQSVLAPQAGLSPMLHSQDIAWALEATVWHPGLGEEDFFQYWIGSVAPGWKATFSPAGGDLATIGVFVRGHGQVVQSFFQSFLEKFKAYKATTYRNIDQMKLLSMRNGGDPIAVLPGDIVSDRFMVTGGAAGQSGLAYSMRAGTICGSVAGKAVAKGDVSRRSLSEYERLWKAEFGWEYRMGRASLETLRNMSDEEIDKLVCSLSGRDLISDGTFCRKATYAGIKIASVQPKVIANLAMNLIKG
jgi:digeranylgeranylglycerophospholipid reductase